MKRQRNYAAEYARRVERGRSKGLSRAAARGHGPSDKAAGADAFTNPAGKLERALKLVKRGSSLKKAATDVHVAPERLRAYIGKHTAVTRQGGKLVIKDSRPRRFPVYSEGSLKGPVLVPSEASKASFYLHDVFRTLRSGHLTYLEPYRQAGVTDVNGKFVPFETDLNVLYRLDTAGDLYFPEFYKIANGEASHG